MPGIGASRRHRAGGLSQRLTIQRGNPGFGADTNQPTLSWILHATRWGSVEQLTGRELVEAQQVVARATHRVVIRHLDTVTPEMRISTPGGATLNIVSAGDPTGRKTHTVLLCSEAVT